MDKHTWHKAQLNLQSSNMPLPRWGHSCCVIGNEVVYFGGYAESVYMNDVWSFNTTTMEWTEIKTTGETPSHRSNCSMSYDSENDRIVIFGGGGANKKRFNSINVLNWMTKEWSEIPAKENEPSPWERTYHCAELLYPYLIVFGGEGMTDMDDLWVFNFETNSWKELPIDKSKPRPCARRFHSSAIIGNQFFVIGGCYAKYRCLSDVYSLDMTPLLRDGDMDRLEWRDRRPSGAAFLTRWGHTSTVYDNKIYIFGGRFSNDLNDILVIDNEKNTMKALKIAGELPKARRRHSACFVGSCMLIFGGFNGEYYNDLHYINCFELKSKLQVPANICSKNIAEFVNEKSLADIVVKTRDGQEFYLHRGLLVKGLKHENLVEQLLRNIEGKLSSEALYNLVSQIYKGYGTVPEQIRVDYGIDIPENQEDYQEVLKHELIKKEQNILTSSLIRKKNLMPTVIPLNDEEFSSFLDTNREHTYKDSALLINDSFLLKTNSAALALASPFFRNLFSGSFHDGKKEARLHLNSNNLVMFEITLNYLLLEKVVVPVEMGLYSWMQLFQMADYLCVQRLKTVCEQQICSLVSQKNCEEILSFGLEFHMSTLTLFCADFLMKCMVNREDKFFYEESNCEAKNNVLEIIYNLSRFDILQVKLERMKAVEDGLKHKDSVQTQDVDDKENYETNHAHE